MRISTEAPAVPASEASLKLQVTAAYPRDTGRGLARLGPAAFAALGLEAGDIVEVAGRRATVCRASPSEDEPGVQLDEISRQNAGVEVSETARLRHVRPADGESVVLRPARGAEEIPEPEILRQILDGHPVRTGDLLRAILPDTRGVDLEVVETAPEMPCRIVRTTRITLVSGVVDRPEIAATPDVSYADVGGLAAQLARVREIVELPLRLPEVFERLGIDPPKGVLLHGPPGCGKTLIARAAAHEIRASFFSISGPEVIHKFYGESEAHLRMLFEEAAAQAPSIIFLDEVDAIAPAREKARGDVEKRVVAQLLALMDGLKRRGRVIVLAATNRPNALDPALRRPGRFDREIEVSIPDRGGRGEVLAVHSRSMPLAADVDLDALAGCTHGFVGADLEALCREAAMSRLRRLLPELDLERGTVPAEELADVEVTMADFREALRSVQPSALREVAIEVPAVRWDDVGGLGAVKERLLTVFDWPLHHPEIFAAAAIRPTKGILLHGPPGCGKTLLARALAARSGVNFIAVKGPELFSMYVGESEERLRDLFRTARRASPAILFFDEIDALLATREASGQNDRVAERLLGQFLAELDGIEELRDVLVLGATNRLDRLDPALLRPDRFDEVIEIPRPDVASRREIFRVHLDGKPLAFEPDLDALAAATEGFTGAGIAEAVRRAALVAIGRVLEGPAPHDPAALTVESADLDAAFRTIRSHIQEEP